MYTDDQRRDGHRGGSGGGGGGGGGFGGRKGVPLSDLDPALTAVSHTVIGCARDVHVALGPGYEPGIYAEAMKAEMTERGVTFREQHPFDVRYKGRVVGQAVAELFVADRFLLHLMAKPGDVCSYERLRLRALLRAADLELGLIINFAGRLVKDGLVRVLNPDKITSLRGADHTDHHEDGLLGERGQ